MTEGRHVGLSIRARGMRAALSAVGVALLVSAAPANATVSTGDDPEGASGPLAPAASPPPSISGTQQAGEMLTGTDGFSSAFSHDRIWLRCNGGGTGCSQIATTNDYTLTAADIGNVLKFRVRGSHLLGDYREADAVTGVIPTPPANSTPPQITGTARHGELLTATQGSWTGTAPLSYTYVWERCDGGCTQVATGALYGVAAADVGKQLKVTVTAAGPGGSAAASAITGTVAAKPPAGGSGGGGSTGGGGTTPVTTPGTTRLRKLSPFPVVAIGGRVFRSGVLVSQLRVFRAPRGATVTVTCRGRGCPFRRARRRIRRRSGLRLRSLERRLRSGTVIVIVVRKGNAIGKYTRLRVRRGAPPARIDRCIRPGARRPSACPG